MHTSPTIPPMLKLFPKLYYRLLTFHNQRAFFLWKGASKLRKPIHFWGPDPMCQMQPENLDHFDTNPEENAMCDCPPPSLSPPLGSQTPTPLSKNKPAVQGNMGNHQGIILYFCAPSGLPLRTRLWLVFFAHARLLCVLSGTRFSSATTRLNPF